MKHLFFLMFLSFSALAGVAGSYEGELVSYNDKEFTVKFANKKTAKFELKHMFSGDLHKIDQLLGKKIRFKVPLQHKLKP